MIEHPPLPPFRRERVWEKDREKEKVCYGQERIQIVGTHMRCACEVLDTCLLFIQISFCRHDALPPTFWTHELVEKQFRTHVILETPFGNKSDVERMSAERTSAERTIAERTSAERTSAERTSAERTSM